MSLYLPEELRWLGWIAGSSWPDGDEDGMWALAAAWQSASEELRGQLSAIETAKRDTMLAYPQGSAAEAMGKLFDGLRSGDQSVESLAELLQQVSDSTFDLGTQLQATKLTIIISLCWLAIEILWAWLFPPTAPAVEAAAISTTRSFLRVAEDTVQKAITNLARKLGASAEKRYFWKSLAGGRFVLPTAKGWGVYGVKFGETALTSGGLNAAVQLGQMADGKRRHFDGKEFGVSMFASVAGTLPSREFARYLGRGIDRFGARSLDTVWGRTGRGAFIGAASAVVSSATGNLAVGAATGDWSSFTSPTGWGGGIARGAMVGGARGAFAKSTPISTSDIRYPLWMHKPGAPRTSTPSGSPAHDGSSRRSSIPLQPLTGAGGGRTGAPAGGPTGTGIQGAQGSSRPSGPPSSSSSHATSASGSPGTHVAGASGSGGSHMVGGPGHGGSTAAVGSGHSVSTPVAGHGGSSLAGGSGGGGPHGVGGSGQGGSHVTTGSGHGGSPAAGHAGSTPAGSSGGGGSPAVVGPPGSLAASGSGHGASHGVGGSGGGGSHVGGSGRSLVESVGGGQHSPVGVRGAQGGSSGAQAAEGGSARGEANGRGAVGGDGGSVRSVGRGTLDSDGRSFHTARGTVDSEGQSFHTARDSFPSARESLGSGQSSAHGSPGGAAVSGGGAQSSAHGQTTGSPGRDGFVPPTSWQSSIDGGWRPPSGYGSPADGVAPSGPGRATTTATGTPVGSPIPGGPTHGGSPAQPPNGSPGQSPNGPSGPATPATNPLSTSGAQSPGGSARQVPSGSTGGGSSLTGPPSGSGGQASGGSAGQVPSGSPGGGSSVANPPTGSGGQSPGGSAHSGGGVNGVGSQGNQGVGQQEPFLGAGKDMKSKTRPKRLPRWEPLPGRFHAPGAPDESVWMLEDGADLVDDAETPSVDVPFRL
ncbi:hypothetical protein F5X71_19175 [Nocardia brasiliensis]|uniref:Outer membrane channel protein CpnT-like N-terminal domain-containing protein n=1 Tax=Nocardia brasiliensis TaxID=37326 RepID=A0A6G9XTC8_NOCBR|nr:hypothetical protein [Nocardia brasiliensis]QIS04169.1 hypothetical protein F5X71_19175 [Nocardia brasiliensis]